MKYICAIDPSNLHSAYVIVNADDLKPIKIGRLENPLMYCQMVDDILSLSRDPVNDFEIVIEDMQNYGDIVGKSVFDTCKWIGRLEDRFENSGFIVTEIVRAQEKKVVCPGVRGVKDTNIRHALIERFAADDPNMGKGSKKRPGWFYGFRADIWQAYAVAVTYHDLKESGEI